MEIKIRKPISATIFLCFCALFFQAQKGGAATITSFSMGDWNTSATWIGGIVPASGDDVIISHAVTLGASATVASLSIGAGGTLTASGNLTVTGAVTLSYGGIFQGSGSPTIDGDLNISVSTGPVNFGSRFDPDGNATIGGSLNIGEGDIGASLSSTSSTVTVSGVTNFLAKIKNIYKKTLVCQGGAVANGGSTAAEGVSISMVNSTLTIPSGQTFLCTATDPGDVGLGNATLGYVNTLNLLGTLSKTGSGTLTMKNVTFNNAGSMDFQGGISRFAGTNDILYSGLGNINVHSGATLLNLTGATNVLNYANETFTNNGTVSQFDLKFSGSSAQHLAGNGVIRGIELNNAAGLDIDGSQTFIFPGNFTFTNGKATLHNGDLTIPNDSNIENAGPTKYFVTSGIGMLVITAMSGTRVFPIGPNTSTYNPVTVAASTASTFGALVKVAPDVPTGGTGYVNRQWEIDGAVQASLTFQWNSATDQMGDFTPTPCQVLRDNGSGGWDPLSSGNASCPSGVCTRSQSNVTTFSKFAIASGIALPIELTEFRGDEAGPVNHFSWETASESNTKNHLLQRSLDGIGGWSTIAERKGAGNALVPTFYEADDKLPISEAYYRLFVEDNDGRGEASPIVFIKRKQGVDGQFATFPNPIGADGFWLNIPQSAIGLPLSVSVLDLAGRLVLDKKMAPDLGEGPIFIEVGTRLPAGAYLLKVGSERMVQALPILVGR